MPDGFERCEALAAKITNMHGYEGLDALEIRNKFYNELVPVDIEQLEEAITHMDNNIDMAFHMSTLNGYLDSFGFFDFPEERLEAMAYDLNQAANDIYDVDAIKSVLIELGDEDLEELQENCLSLKNKKDKKSKILAATAVGSTIHSKVELNDVLKQINLVENIISSKLKILMGNALSLEPTFNVGSSNISTNTTLINSFNSTDNTGLIAKDVSDLIGPMLYPEKDEYDACIETEKQITILLSDTPRLYDDMENIYQMVDTNLRAREYVKHLSLVGKVNSSTVLSVQQKYGE